MFKRLALAALFFLLPATAWAGSFVDGKYTSNLGYTFTPPSGWERVDASTAVAASKHIPRNINIDGLKRFDVVFFPKFSKINTSLEADNERIAKNKATLEDKDADHENLLPPIVDDTEPPEFSPTITILALKYIPSLVTDEMVAAFNENLLENITNAAGYAQEFKAESTLKQYHAASDIGDGNTFEFRIQFRKNSRLIKVEQTLIYHNDTTFIVTCSSDANDSSSNLPSNWCQQAVNSMSF